MTRILFLPLFLCISFGAHAQSIKAQDLEQLCDSKAESDLLSCALVVKAYMDGFIEGVAKGVLDTYKYDQQVLSLVRDTKMSDMAPRVTKVVELSTCIQRVPAGEMANTFVDYVRRNPSLREETYRKAMTKAIVSKYCGK
ncbi:hypothetical protein EGI97_01430 [Stutzerimonas xanthomarina]|nr:hypothetical protein EGI97_01430 [Stutzerimonas xanthomarina]